MDEIPAPYHFLQKTLNAVGSVDIEPAQTENFRVVIEGFSTAEEAIAFRDMLLSDHTSNLSYIQKEYDRHNWRTWTFG